MVSVLASSAVDHGFDPRSGQTKDYNLFFFWCFNATYSNSSAISWLPVLMVEESGVPGENHRPWASNW